MLLMVWPADSNSKLQGLLTSSIPKRSTKTTENRSKRQEKVQGMIRSHKGFNGLFEIDVIVDEVPVHWLVRGRFLPPILPKQIKKRLSFVRKPWKSYHGVLHQFSRNSAAKVGRKLEFGLHERVPKCFYNSLFLLLFDLSFIFGSCWLELKKLHLPVQTSFNLLIINLF